MSVQQLHGVKLECNRINTPHNSNGRTSLRIREFEHSQTREKPQIWAPVLSPELLCRVTPPQATETLTIFTLSQLLCRVPRLEDPQCREQLFNVILGPVCHSGPALEPDTSSQTFSYSPPHCRESVGPPQTCSTHDFIEGEAGSRAICWGMQDAALQSGSSGKAAEPGQPHDSPHSVAGAGGKSKRSSCNVSAQRHCSDSPLWREEKSCLCLPPVPSAAPWSSPTAAVRIRLTPSAGKLSNLLK